MASFTQVSSAAEIELDARHKLGRGMAGELSMRAHSALLTVPGLEVYQIAMQWQFRRMIHLSKSFDKDTTTAHAASSHSSGHLGGERLDNQVYCRSFPIEYHRKLSNSQREACRDKPSL